MRTIPSSGSAILLRKHRILSLLKGPSIPIKKIEMMAMCFAPYTKHQASAGLSCRRLVQPWKESLLKVFPGMVAG
nr:MAG TPA: hypothetical protein [Caudoviricetes sp.]